MSEKQDNQNIVIENGTGYTSPQEKQVGDNDTPCNNFAPKNVLNFFDRRCGTCAYKFGKFCTHK